MVSVVVRRSSIVGRPLTILHFNLALLKKLQDQSLPYLNRSTSRIYKGCGTQVTVTVCIYARRPVFEMVYVLFDCMNT